MRILGISGSLRKASTNTGLLRAAAKLFPPEVSFEIADISDLPLFNGDLERPSQSGDWGFPESVTRFRKQVQAAHGILFASPENNYSVSAPLKNAVDWASRPQNVWNGKPAAVVGAGGGSGSIKSHYHLRQSAVYVNMFFLNKPELAVRIFEPPTKFDPATGDLVDEETRKRLVEVVAALVAWVKKMDPSLH